MIAGHPGAADGDGEQREGEARRDPDGTDAETRDDESGGHQPVRFATIALGADEWLDDGVRDAGGEREHAGCRIAVVSLHDEEGQQGEQGARAQVGAPVPQREREQRRA